MRKRSGVTLIEVIVSTAIIGIMGISFLNIFDVGLINISRAGNRTEELLEVKNEVDIGILDSTIGEFKQATVLLPGGYTSIVDGRLINGIDTESLSIEIKTFTVD
jgi:prepilin-type N-terminal cleavage/methylation domain-containing protein